MHFSRVIFVCLWLLIANSTCEEFTVTPITTSSGLYYEKVGEVLLSNNNWQFVTSVDYKGYLLFYEYLFKQASAIGEFCQTISSKECDDRYNTIRTNLNRIEETDESMANFLGITAKPRRVKRFWGAIGRFFSNVGRGLVGAVRGIFGGGSSQVDLSVYDRQIGDLRNGQRELENQLNAQKTLFLIDSEKKNFQIEWLSKTQGEIQNKIGTLQSTFEKDSEKKDKEIKELRKMLNETEEKIKMQGEIQKKLVSQVDEIQKKLLQVDEDIKDINGKIANNTRKIKQLELKVKLNTISIDFNFLMTQFETEQKTLFQVIKNANRGELDPYILTPLNLVEMLEDIQPNLPEETKFPFYPNIENAHKLYNIIKPSVYLYNSKIIFILQIPLVNSKTFNFHKITSLPFPVSNDKFVFILPQEPYLIIDNNYNEYMLMSSNDFNDFCMEIGKSKYLCKQIQQISFVHSTTDCEVILFKSTKKLSDSCDKRIMLLDKPMFLQLQQTRTWIYTVPDQENLILNCGKKRSTIAIEGAGFIQVSEQCSVRTTNFLLVSLVEFTKPVEANYSPPFNLTKFLDVSEFENFHMKSSRYKQMILPFDFEELDKISSVLEGPKQNLTALYALLVIPIILLSVLAYLVYKKKVNVGNALNINKLFSRTRPPPSATSQSEPDANKVQIRLKVHKNNDNIKKISVHEDPSTTDPDSEYLTVRFKVKKDTPVNNKPTKEHSMDKRSLMENNEMSTSDTEYSRKNENYLSELRKLKPNVCQNNTYFE